MSEVEYLVVLSMPDEPTFVCETVCRMLFLDTMVCILFKKEKHIYKDNDLEIQKGRFCNERNR